MERGGEGEEAMAGKGEKFSHFHIVVPIAFACVGNKTAVLFEKLQSGKKKG